MSRKSIPKNSYIYLNGGRLRLTVSNTGLRLALAMYVALSGVFACQRTDASAGAQKDLSGAVNAQSGVENRAPGDVDDSELYTLVVPEKLMVAVGTETPFEIEFIAKEGYIIKKKTPLVATFKWSKNAEGAPTIGKEKIANEGADYIDAQHVKVSNTLSGSQKGQHTLDVDLKFFVCNDTLCRRYKESAIIPVIVSR